MYDVIVVGGSFAGLNFSRVAAINGLKVLVLERRQQIADHLGSTGIFIKEVPEMFQIPKRFCTNPINKMHLFSPSGKSLVLSSKTERFYMSDTKAYLKWLGEQAQKWNVNIKLNSNYLSKEISKNLIKVKFKEKNKIKEIKTKFVVGADGSVSSVANSFSLSKNQKFLFGTEQILTGIKGIEKDSFYCFLDYDSAPGYLCWVAPNKDKFHIGLAGHLNKFDSSQALTNFKNKLKKYFDFSHAKLIETKQGLIPIGGLLDKTVTNRCLLLGDSAGMITPLSCGGIFPSLSYSIKAGESVADYLLNNNKQALEDYSRYNTNLKDHLNFEKKLRIAYDTLNSNELLEDAFNVINTKEGKQLIKSLYLKSSDHNWKTIFSSSEEFLKDPKAYALFGKLILDELNMYS